MSKNVKLSVALVVAFVVVLGVVAAVVASRDRADVPAATGGAASEPSTESQLVREDSHRISTAEDGKVTLVEFLDFECEACRAAYPVVEALRQEYDGRVTVVARYFPIPSHANAENAALAVEVAAQQDRFEEMYKKMYETQAQWGEQENSQADVFRGFAEDLGLDMAAFDAAVADPATLERIQKDVTDGIALGVEGTPTFFLNGEKIEPTSAEDFKAMIDDALES